MAINKSEWEQLRGMIATVDQKGIEEQFGKYAEITNEYVDKNIRDMKAQAKEDIAAATRLLDDITKRIQEKEAEYNKSFFSTELDKALSVLEKHGYYLVEHEKQFETYTDTERNIYCVKIVDIHDVLKYVSKYCQAKAKAEGYVDYIKVKDAGLTERSNNRHW